MMAAFIVAIRGTVAQAVILGLSAAASHSVVVWVLALAALYYGNALIGEELEPWLIGLSGLVIICVGIWTGLTTLKHRRRHHDHDHQRDTRHHQHHHSHQHDHRGVKGEAMLAPSKALDAHAAAHAAALEKQFQGKSASLWQVLVFGLSGGFIPCPAAITVLLLCLHAGQLSVGIGLVSAFSIGLAVTLVAAGLIATLSMRFAATRFNGLLGLLDKAPLISAVIICAIGGYMLMSSWLHLSAH